MLDAHHDSDRAMFSAGLSKFFESARWALTENATFPNIADHFGDPAKHRSKSFSSCVSQSLERRMSFERHSNVNGFAALPPAGIREDRLRWQKILCAGGPSLF
jgi:hypothetical protein